jgi:hypothetical protein
MKSFSAFGSASAATEAKRDHCYDFDDYCDDYACMLASGSVIEIEKRDDGCGDNVDDLFDYQLHHHYCCH